ncbi:ABC transporter ATP-binding protein [Phaeacidiphilus oryzae]|uniref:ABC transporter ATP-binding protein n=1 Tax=Phaeacidiphilus oryzae TaxID=348818 RepID=UPI0009FE548A|nr:ABC transporter ATP-binding protein [Phaeacidiphilus oryzae]
MAAQTDRATSPPPDTPAGSPGSAGRGARIELTNVTRRFTSPSGELFTAIREVNFTVEPGEFCAVVGPTGCGKSTTLGMVSGLDSPSGGTVRVGGAEVKGITPGVSFMFQQDALLPWKTVLGNVAMGPTFRGVSKQKAHADARDWLRRVGLDGFADHHPHQLSGGMRKRASMAAALINEPSILLMDEPFGALDVQTKAIMSNELLGLWEELKPSVLFITHDLEEAVALADKVVVMTSRPGTIKGVFEIDLPRPRGAVQEIRFDPRFLELHHQIWESLREEVDAAYAQTQGAAAGAGAGQGSGSGSGSEGK